MDRRASEIHAQIQPMTARPSLDLVLVHFVGCHGAVSIAHVMSLLGVGRTAAYRRVAACAAQGLLERLDLIRAAPALIRATRAGLRYAGLGLEVASVSPGSVKHWLHSTSTAIALGERSGHENVISARELALLERIEGRPIASAKLGEHPTGAPALHRPDLVLTIGERPIAIEVELTPKSPERLVRIIRAWRRARWVGEVRYYCAPGTPRRAVERAIREARAEERVRVLEAVAS